LEPVTKTRFIFEGRPSFFFKYKKKREKKKKIIKNFKLPKTRWGFDGFFPPKKIPFLVQKKVIFSELSRTILVFLVYNEYL